MRDFFSWLVFLCVLTLGWMALVSLSDSEAGDKTANALPAADEQSSSDQTDEKKGPEQNNGGPLKGKAADNTLPLKENAAEKGLLKDDGNNLKSGDAKAPSKAESGLKGHKGEAGEDRPWIIKEPPRGTVPPPKEKVIPLHWIDEEQQDQCDTLLKEIQKSLDKARTYSVRGDNCATARHAANFADLANRCKNECPEGFLESKGYSEKIMRNVNVLLELGKKACLK